MNARRGLLDESQLIESFVRLVEVIGQGSHWRNAFSKLRIFLAGTLPEGFGQRRNRFNSGVDVIDAFGSLWPVYAVATSPRSTPSSAVKMEISDVALS